MRGAIRAVLIVQSFGINGRAVGWVFGKNGFGTAGTFEVKFTNGTVISGGFGSTVRRCVTTTGPVKAC
jgi:hypothetical protein